ASRSSCCRRLHSARSWRSTTWNIAMAGVSIGTGSPIDSWAVRYNSASIRPLLTLRPTSGQAAARKASGGRAVIVAGGGKPKQDLQQPLRPRRAVVAPDLREVEREIVGDEAVLQPRLGEGDLVVGLRQLLDVEESVDQGVVVVPPHAGLQHVEDDLGV